jgi:hypothetical protein
MLSRSRSTLRTAGWRQVSSGRVPGKSGRWSIPSSNDPGGVRYREREEARILVIDIPQFDAVPMSVGCEPESLPMEEILGLGQCDSWTVRRERCIGHDVTMERFDVGDPWVFAASATIGRRS